MGVYCENATLMQHSKINQCSPPFNSLKKTNNMIISIDEENTFEKIQPIHNKKFLAN